MGMPIALGEAVDDAHVRLVWDDEVDVFKGVIRTVRGCLAGLFHDADGELEDLFAVHFEVVLAVLIVSADAAWRCRRRAW